MKGRVGTLVVLAALWTPALAEPLTVKRLDIREQIRLSGRVVSASGQSAEVFAPYANARIDKVFVTRGQAVREGDVVVMLLHPTSKAHYQQARQTLLAARASYEAARSRYRERLAAYETRYEAARRAELDTRAAVRQAERLAQVQARQAIPDPHTGASIRLGTDPQLSSLARQDRVELSVAQQRRKEARLDLVEARARLWHGVQKYQARLREARADFAQAQAGRKQAEVHAPVTGQVTEVLVHSGDTVGVPEAFPLVRIADLSELVVEAPLSEAVAPLVQRGNPVQLEFQGGITSNGKVLSKTVNDEGEPELKISFANPAGRVKPWMQASLNVTISRAALVVPQLALSENSSGTWTVSVHQQDGSVALVPVHRGSLHGEFVEVYAPQLHAGDELLPAGPLDTP